MTTKVSNNIKDSCTKNELIEHVLRTRIIVLVLYCMGKKTEFDNLMETDKSSHRMLKSTHTFAIRSG